MITYSLCGAALSRLRVRGKSAAATALARSIGTQAAPHRSGVSGEQAGSWIGMVARCVVRGRRSTLPDNSGELIMESRRHVTYLGRPAACLGTYIGMPHLVAPSGALCRAPHTHNAIAAAAAAAVFG